jgi:hypothetical protein
VSAGVPGQLTGHGFNTPVLTGGVRQPFKKPNSKRAWSRLEFGISELVFVSDFEFRYSDFS